MKEFKFETQFGEVTGWLAEDVVEFESNQAKIIGRDSDNDGPYWENSNYDWQRLNEMCHELMDNNLYGIASDDSLLISVHAQPNVIDSTSSYEEMETFSAWVCKDTFSVYDGVRRVLEEEIRSKLNLWTAENLSAPENAIGLQELLTWSQEVFDLMYNDDEEFEAAATNVAKENGYENIW